jgi:ubiquinone/menaquinone biosynthesis C-methylase UbiE
MDCEKMTFENSKFDVIFDFGTFSSLNMEIAIHELWRVLKNDGTIICIETYGHNPFMKIKRWLNVLLGKRTKWAAQHIMKKQSWKMISSKFEISKIYYFHFLVLFLPIFLKILPKSIGDKFLSFTEKVDSVILRIKFLQFLAFKTVTILNNPKNEKNF